ncbi:PAAR domain-containing protein [Candidatus Symbiopectobacterium sp.]|uniref:PAAR domain-containing protein n=1 Tax=Candidatus Symbiopectobacterium sp. TaxID=2816440 RepID=UPI0025B8824F|nr:PAAR domain-containing protein [Candidatus Symbiopectobacterium sp.]
MRCCKLNRFQPSSHPPTSVVSGSSTVKVDGIPLVLQGYSLAPHGHSRTISGGSSNVFIDGKPAVRTENTVSCGGALIGGGSVDRLWSVHTLRDAVVF